jgi:glycosyltransferase involved in cell wall biosynthesis
MKGRHVLVANVFFAPNTYGGATVVAEQVARVLIRQSGVRISAVSLIARSDLAPYAMVRAEADGIASYLINVPPGRGYREAWDNPEITARIAALIDGLRPDLLHVHCIQEIGAGVIGAAKTRGVPVVLSVHDFWWLCERQFMLRPDHSYCGQNPIRIEDCRGCVADIDAARERFGWLCEQAAQADLITYPSRFARDLSEASGMVPGRGAVWENGVCTPGPEFPALQAARRAHDPRVSFGFLGGPSQIKGWPLIRLAFAGLKRSDYRLLLVEGSLDASWWKGVDLSPFNGEVAVHPRFAQNGMDDFYAKIDVLLFPSQWKETFGLAIREALARGIAVIQTDSGGTAEHGAAGDLIPIGAGPEMLRSQIEAALTNPARGREPVVVQEFAGQARAFRDMVRPLLK